MGGHLCAGAFSFAPAVAADAPPARAAACRAGGYAWLAARGAPRGSRADVSALFRRAAIVLFGVLPLPDWLGADKALAAGIKPLHALLAMALMALVALHVAGALKHQLIDRDGLLSRMK